MRKLDLNDFKSYHFLSGLRYSPCGAMSALAASKANKKNGYDAHLYLYREGKATRLTATGKEKLYIWDNAETILFASDRNPDLAKRRKEGVELTCFYRINVNGGEATEAFVLPVNVSSIEKISGGLYAVMAVTDCDREDFSPIDPDKTSEAASKRKKEREAWQIIDEVPFWFNGAGFTNKTRSRLFIYDENTNTLKSVSDPMLPINDFKVAPCLKYIAYTAVPFINNVRGTHDNVYVYDIDRDTSDLMLEQKLHISDFDYWEDKLIIAGTEAKNHGTNENPCFWLLSCRDGSLSYLADYDNWIGMPVGSDCRLGGGNTYKVVGDTLYFSSPNINTADIFALELKTGKLNNLTGPLGSFDFFDVTEDGAIQAVAFLDDRLQELYEVKGNKYERLTSFNEDIHNEILYSKPEHHTITDSEGFVVDGWVIPPAGYEKGKKYPGILHIHGGPKTIQGDVFFHEMQLWAAAGYFVLYCNPRGSDGKGNVFADVRGKYGTCDYDNIMQFTDEMLVAYPDMAGDKLGVTGGSYGGFMTNWVIGHTDRFKAAASQRSISNWISKLGTTDIGYRFVEDQQQATTWNNHDKLWSQSPLKYADKCVTPTLFIHSDNDYRCWTPEGIQMFTALKLHGCEARMCLFHGETHELSRSGKPESRQKRMEEILGWMDKYLKA